MSDSNVVLVARVILGGVLAFAGIGKLANHRTFVTIVRSYKLVPEATIAALSWLVPLAEIVLAALLLSGTLLPWTSLAAAGLLVAFSLAISMNLARGYRDTSCGCCGNASDTRIGWHVVLRNLGLLGLALISGGFTPYVASVAFASAMLIVVPAAAVGARRNGERRMVESRL